MPHRRVHHYAHRLSVALVLFGTTRVLGDVFSYEGNSFPEDAEWNVVQLVCEPERWLEDGWFVQYVELCPGYPPPGGKEGTYRRPLEEYVGAQTFFVEWRMETDGDRSELPWGGPSNFAAGSNGPVNYRFSISQDMMDLNRDNTLPIVPVEFEAGVPHTHRLELYGDELYVWFLDGEIVDSGVPEGAFPSFNPRITWSSKAAWLPNTTRWDYIRYGAIPEDGSGDFDSDGNLDGRDFYFFGDYLSGPGSDAGPGGRFADFDSDTDVDLTDFAAFQNGFTGAP
ncbi:MAG: hypothetical protein ABII12_00465 [Planctomycetota bacterium]